MDGTLTGRAPPRGEERGSTGLTQAEFDRFHALNAAYAEKFGFPFIICVR